MWAHSKNRFGVRHRLEDHLRGTAELARRFAAPFGLGELAWWTGLIHDGGKCWQAWQDRLLLVEPTNGRVGLDHKSFGVQMARKHDLKPVEWMVAGHHGGLTNRAKINELFGDLAQEQRLRSGPWADAERQLRVAVPEMFTQVPRLPADFADGADRLASEFLLRFLFSCLVDADVLDTKAHFESTAPRVGADLDAQALLDRFLTRRKEYLATRKPGKMDPYREQVFADSLAAADECPGLFRLTTPTGTAKTIGAAAFALRHAVVRRKRRIIVAVPFITITEQNAEVYRRLLDPEDPSADRVVLEHHSQVDLDEAERDQPYSWQRLAAENWDAPFIVTTTVQFFESLFGRTTSATRKLHRIANSVVILDEVQALPHLLLPQVADALRILTERFGVTVVLSSATQPEFAVLSPLKKLITREIISDPGSLFTECQRVRFEWRLAPEPTLTEIAAEAATYEQVLLVVNTVRDARDAFLVMKEAAAEGRPVLHLSTGMCPAHRRAVLDRVKELLKSEMPVLLVSTSLVEAGVDLDFPTVFRAVGPPESMAQVAGRCNREGNLGKRAGRVIIFKPSDGGMPPSYQTQVEKALLHFGPEKAEPEDPAALTLYFRALYRTLGIDRRGKPSQVIAANRRDWDFRAVADGPLDDAGTRRVRRLAFRLITEDTVPVLVRYGGHDADQIIDDCLRRLGRRPDLTVSWDVRPDMTALRDLQPYITNLRRDTAIRPDLAGRLSTVIGDLRLWRGDYDDDYGIVLEPREEDFFC